MTNVIVRRPEAADVFLMFRRPTDWRDDFTRQRLAKMLPDAEGFLARYATDLALFDDAYNTSIGDIDGTDTPLQSERWALLQVFRFCVPRVTLRLKGPGAVGYAGFLDRPEVPPEGRRRKPDFSSIELFDSRGTLRRTLLLSSADGNFGEADARGLMEQVVATASFTPLDRHDAEAKHDAAAGPRD